MDDTSVYGSRRWGLDTCECFSAHDGRALGDVARRYNELPPGFPYPSKDKRVCGLKDGNKQQYASATGAAAAGAKVVNCGPCGSCSTVHDVSLYRKFAKPMTVMLSRCALVYLFAGESLARSCLQREFADAGGFTDACLNRFMDNYGCTVTHCYRECIFKWDNPLSASNNVAGALSHSGMVDGTKLTPCMHCDEVFCSPVFISAAGANRRMSGCVSSSHGMPISR